LAAFGHPCRQESSADIYHDVKGMEHHISPQTLQAIEALLFELRQDPTLVARIRSRASGSRGSA
jgi:Mn-dependent DtxR family transcriptional regulator